MFTTVFSLSLGNVLLRDEWLLVGWTPQLKYGQLQPDAGMQGVLRPDSPATRTAHWWKLPELHSIAILNKTNVTYSSRRKLILHPGRYSRHYRETWEQISLTVFPRIVCENSCPSSEECSRRREHWSWLGGERGRPCFCGSWPLPHQIETYYIWKKQWKKLEEDDPGNRK